jgi:hypothetical protein
MTDNERKLLEELPPETIHALGALFCPDRSAIRDTLEKNILALSDEEYGKAMKVLYATEQHFNSCMERLKLISKKMPKTKSPIAPM